MQKFFGDVVDLRAQLTALSPGRGVPTGRVTFADGVSTLDSPVIDATGLASLDLIPTAPGSHSYSARYGGDLNFQPVTSDVRSIVVSPFSSDETFVYAYGKRVYRPLVVPWDFTATGTTYWASPYGSDTDPGTYARPFLTIGRALNAAQPGDVVYVMPGTYVEQVVPPRSGTLGNPIMLSCAPTALGGGLGTVTVQIPSALITGDWSSGGPSNVYLDRINYFTLNGIIMQGPVGMPGCPASENFTQNGFTYRGLAGDGVGVTVTNCISYNQLHCGYKEMDSPVGGLTLHGNVAYSVGTDTQDHCIYYTGTAGGTIDANVLLGAAGYGLHLYSAPSLLSVTRNLCAWNFGGCVMGGGNSTFYHNTLYKNTFVGFFYFRGDCIDNVVKNNIAAQNGVGYLGDFGYDNGGGLLGDPTGNLDDYNDYNPSGANPFYFSQHNTIGAHEQNVDPAFVDPDNGDLRLQSASPCRGAADDGGDRGAFTPDTTVTYPVGIYGSMGTGQDGILNDVSFNDLLTAGCDWLSGALYRPKWSEMEPSPGVYHWDSVDATVALLAGFGKKVTLQPMCGPESPAWLYAAPYNVPKFVGSVTIPVPWDAAFQQRWRLFVAALAARYASNPNVVLTHVTGSSASGMEMWEPKNSPLDTAAWKTLGWTNALFIAHWQACWAAFAGFPAIDLELHPVLYKLDNNGNPILSQQDYTVAGAFDHPSYFTWLSGKTNVYPPLEARMASYTGFKAAQLIGNFKGQPTRFQNNDWTTAFNQGLAWDVKYYEVWRADILEPTLQPYLESVAAQLAA